VDNDKILFGVNGHIYQRSYKPQDNNWFKVNGLDIIDKTIIKNLKKPDILDLIIQFKKLGNITLGIFTDFDNQGELIGSDIMEICQENLQVLQVKRYCISAILKYNVLKAYKNPKELNHNLIKATQARHTLDLIWGAALTRFFSLTLSKKFVRVISIGRVQTPVLFILYKRYKQITEFKPEKYYIGYFTIKFKNVCLQFKTNHISKPIELDKDFKPEFKILESQKIINTPKPMNVTDLLSLSKSISRNVKEIMDLAQRLYLDGYITYPRTDSQNISKEFNIRNLLSNLSNIYPNQISKILKDNPNFKYRSGKSDSAHAAIFPVNSMDFLDPKIPDKIKQQYKLISKRFISCFQNPSKYLTKTIKFTYQDLEFSITLKTNVDLGWYPITQDIIPEDLSNFQILSCKFQELYTKPPKMYSENEMIKLMENSGLGTKSTRHNYFKILKLRKFIDYKLFITPHGYNLCRILEKYLKYFTNKDLTKSMEIDLQGIQNKKFESEEILCKYKSVLKKTLQDLYKNQDKILKLYELNKT
jgi:DNA topoisomerase-1